MMKRRTLLSCWREAIAGSVFCLWAGLTGCQTPADDPVAPVVEPTVGPVVVRVAASENEDAFAAGKAAAASLCEKMGGVEPKAVILAECFEDEALKKRALEGVCSVLPARVVFGAATYGSFHQEGCLDVDAITLLGIGGDGVRVDDALVENMGIAGLTMEDDADRITERLHRAGTRLAQSLPTADDSRLLVVLPDAHSPKNGLLVAGAQEVLGKDFPMTGGSANKNAGQTFVYHRGRMYQDSAVALLLSGDFEVALSGRQAKENAAVIATAREGASEAVGKLAGEPFAVLAFNCAGRQGKLDNLEDELAAMQDIIGKDVPLFGCYCAGEIGPADTADKDPAVLSSGVGWHVMFAVLAKK